MPSRPGQRSAMKRSASTSMASPGLWIKAPRGAPPSRMRRVSRRVSTLVMATRLRAFSQASK